MNLRHYYLGQSANYSASDVFKHLFSIGLEKDCSSLQRYLSQRYSGKAYLCKNGRSGLALALKAYFAPGDSVIINGFTCYAVYEAVKAAKLEPVFADISRENLNFTEESLKAALSRSKNTKGIIIQNSLGNPIDIKMVEKFAKENDLIIIEDLAHCAGVKYSDGRECGTVGAGVALSFGKDKSIDTISGGAVVLHDPVKHEIEAPSNSPQPSCHLRARFYPLFGMISRGLSHIHLGGLFMQGLVKIHWVEKSADNRLDLKRRISRFEAKLALKQFEKLKRNGESPIRTFCFVKDRDEVLKKLAKAGYYFDGLWYKQPVSPERYYKKIKFPEDNCPEAVYVAKHIINFPTYYTRTDLARAKEIIKPYLDNSKEKGEVK